MPKRGIGGLPALPPAFARKLYKTGQTRGADDDEIVQNRVARTSTALIPFSVWPDRFTLKDAEERFGFGYIVLVSPDDYFGPLAGDKLGQHGLVLGQNCLVFYERRTQWHEHPPEALGWKVATSRVKPLRGQYVARIPGTTASQGDKILHGFTTTQNKGAGIWAYEYASAGEVEACRLQLEALFWLCPDAVEVVVGHGMTEKDAATRAATALETAEREGLLDFEQLVDARVVNPDRQTVCPLCLASLSAEGFFTRMEQAPGREVEDLTVTQLNLFHIEELRFGIYNHRPYNVGWGHHHCNVVVKDSGIETTLEWMAEVLERNRDRA